MVLMTLFKSGAPVKHHAALKLFLRGQDLALGHIDRRHIKMGFSAAWCFSGAPE